MDGESECGPRRYTISAGRDVAAIWQLRRRIVTMCKLSIALEPFSGVSLSNKLKGIFNADAFGAIIASETWALSVPVEPASAA